MIIERKNVYKDFIQEKLMYTIFYIIFLNPANSFNLIYKRLRNASYYTPKPFAFLTIYLTDPEVLSLIDRLENIDPDIPLRLRGFRDVTRYRRDLSGTLPLGTLSYRRDRSVELPVLPRLG
jgi:hypothetical protein